MKDVSGVVAIFVIDGRVIAHAADFNRSCPGGFTVAQAQEHRARDRLSFEVVKELASPTLYNGLSQYNCDRIVRGIKGGSIHVLQLQCPSSEVVETEASGVLGEGT